MKKLSIYFAIIILPLMLTGKLQAQEGRLAYKVKYALSENFDTETMVQYRSSSFDNLWGQAWVVETELNYEKNKYVQPGVSFRYKNQRFKENLEVIELEGKYRAAFDLKLKIPENIKDVSLTNRSRIQHSIDQKNKASTYFRNEFTVKYKVSKHFKAYLSQELFYNLLSSNLNKNRIQGGADIELSDRYEIGMYYILESSLKKQLSNYYIIGAEITIRI